MSSRAGPKSGGAPGCTIAGGSAIPTGPPASTPATYRALSRAYEGKGKEIASPTATPATTAATARTSGTSATTPATAATAAATAELSSLAVGPITAVATARHACGVRHPVLADGTRIPIVVRRSGTERIASARAAMAAEKTLGGSALSSLPARAPVSSGTDTVDASASGATPAAGTTIPAHSAAAASAALAAPAAALVVSGRDDAGAPGVTSATTGGRCRGEPAHRTRAALAADRSVVRESHVV
jgi:hypothetical protein